MNTTYQRVIPRDLFNEAKLLKCLGQLQLIIHDGVDCRRQSCPQALRLEHDGDPFDISQQEHDGALYCTTIRAYAGRNQFQVSTHYNSKEPYPMQFDSLDDSGPVFNDDGSLSADFIAFVEAYATQDPNSDEE